MRWKPRRLPPSIHLPSRFRRYRRGVALVCLVLGLLIGERTLRGPESGSDFSRYHDRTFRVVKVVDGDTLDLDVPDGRKTVTRVRLWGVDTPELSGQDGPMHFGPQAKQFAETVLLDREVHVVLVPQDTRDRYGRLLAFLELERGGVFFNEMLVEAGYAYADPRFDHPYKQRFVEIERHAHRDRVGLWAAVAPADMPAWRRRLDGSVEARSP